MVPTAVETPPQVMRGGPPLAQVQSCSLSPSSCRVDFEDYPLPTADKRVLENLILCDMLSKKDAYTTG